MWYNLSIEISCSVLTQVQNNMKQLGWRCILNNIAESCLNKGFD